LTGEDALAGASDISRSAVGCRDAGIDDRHSVGELRFLVLEDRAYSGRSGKCSGASSKSVGHAEAAGIAFHEVFEGAGVHEVIKLLSVADAGERLRLPLPMELHRGEKEGPVLDDRAAERAAELVANQAVLNARAVGEEVVGRKCLDAVVLEGRPVPLIG